MAAHGGVERRWSDLPADLLSTIYIRSTSAYDRPRPLRHRLLAMARRGVVAKAAASSSAAAYVHGRRRKRDREPRAYSPEDGKAVRIPLPWFPWDSRLVGSYDGGWIAMTSGSDHLHMVNFFSGVRRALRTYGISIQKIIFSDHPFSPDCILAALTTTSQQAIALHRVGCPVGEWKTRGHGFRDITFCNRKLYGFTCSGLLFNFDIGVNKAGALVAISIYRIDTTAMSAFHMSKLASVRVDYIFELPGKLAIVEEVAQGYKTGQVYRVFELVDNDTMTTPKYTWAEVTSLGDHALFLGPACCKAVNLSTAGKRGGVDGNRIYYFEEQYSCLHSSDVKCLTKLDNCSCIVHCCESQDMHHFARIPSRGYYYCKDHVGSGGCNSCTWLWPPDF
ncbi:unnamed protein product [Alopecurus aequalis]